MGDRIVLVMGEIFPSPFILPWWWIEIERCFFLLIKANALHHLGGILWMPIFFEHAGENETCTHAHSTCTHIHAHGAVLTHTHTYIHTHEYAVVLTRTDTHSLTSKQDWHVRRSVCTQHKFLGRASVCADILVVGVVCS